MPTPESLGYTGTPKQTPELTAMLKRINLAPAWDAENVRAEARDYIAKHPEDEFLVRWAMSGYAKVVQAGSESFPR